MAALKAQVGVIGRIPASGSGAIVVAEPCAAVGTVHQTGQPVGIGSVGALSGSALSHLLGGVPGLLVNDRFVSIGKNQEFLRGGSPSFLGLEVLTDALAQDGFAQIFPAAEDGVDGVAAPAVGIAVVMAAVLRVVEPLIGRGDQNLGFAEEVRDLGSAHALAGQVEDLPHHLGGLGIHHQGLLVRRGSDIAVGNRAAAPLAILHPGAEDGLDLVAGVPAVELVHDVEKGREVILLGLGAVDTVVDGDEPHTLVREHDLGIEADLEIVPSEAAHVLDDDRADVARLDLLHHGGEAGAVKIDAAVAVVGEVPEVGKPLLTGVGFEVSLLRRDLSRIYFVYQNAMNRVKNKTSLFHCKKGLSQN